MKIKKTEYLESYSEQFDVLKVEVFNHNMLVRIVLHEEQILMLNIPEFKKFKKIINGIKLIKEKVKK